MAEPKAKTLQQKLGFFDDDLKSPIHDDILKWLDKNLLRVIHTIYRLKEWNPNRVEELRKIATDIFSENIQFTENTVKSINQELERLNSDIKELQNQINESLEKEKDSTDTFKNSEYQNRQITYKKEQVGEAQIKLNKQEERLRFLKNWKGLRELPKRNEIRIIEQPWEYPVTSQSSISSSGYRSGKNIIGFIDLKVTFVYSQLTLKGINFREREITDDVDWAQSESNIESFQNETYSHTLFVEVKTKINSLGELFRQLRTYKEYVAGDFIIVCPDDTEIQTITAQGFIFLKYDKNLFSKP